MIETVVRFSTWDNIGCHQIISPIGLIDTAGSQRCENTETSCVSGYECFGLMRRVKSYTTRGDGTRSLVGLVWLSWIGKEDDTH